MKKIMTVATCFLYLVLGYGLSEKTSFYLINCDNRKYSGMWITEEELNRGGFECRDNEHQRIYKENRLNMIVKLVLSQIGIYL